MYNSVLKTQSFDINSPRDLREYDVVLNNPLCNIIEKTMEKISERSLGGKDEPTIITDRLLMVVTWKEKVLL